MIDPAVIHASAARGDLWYPYAEAMPIPEADTQRKITPTTLILHSMAGPDLTKLDSLRKYWGREDVHEEGTFILDLEGRMAQCVPIDVQADCNYKANGFATSVETQDHGNPTLAVTRWTDAQVEQLAGLAAWEHLHPLCRLPLRRAATWNGGGIGGHRDHSEWSKYVGKTCPGAARLIQIPAVIARAIDIAMWTPDSVRPKEDTDMLLFLAKAPSGGAAPYRNGGVRTTDNCVEQRRWTNWTEIDQLIARCRQLRADGVNAQLRDYATGRLVEGRDDITLIDDIRVLGVVVVDG